MKNSPHDPGTAGPRQRRSGVKACTYTVLPFLVTVALLTGCAAVASTTDSTATGSSADTAAGVAIDDSTTAAEVLAANQETHDDAADYEWDAADVVQIALDGDNATVDSSSGSDAVTISGSTVTITAAGT
ncbi:hypothetical protein [Cryobacterium lactosi]|uniref:hypothetical protein n=1 Tax=Cryobacterium lactosi TaxID=1259202 RepID=UPI0018E0B2EA|nr:hypothetical protein [Cryobacterium lactosi]